jgi:hypothetical protein
MKKSLLLFLTLLFIGLLSASFFWIYEGKYFIGRASIIQTSFSINNSYVFATPLQAEANGQERIRITVFVLNDQGLGVPGRNVVVKVPESVIATSIQPITDQYGKAVFDLASRNAGEYYLEVKVDTVFLPQKIRITFI